ncbi:MAG: DoxX family protein [Actinomycetota bacterium]|nr:DoxX family protein [Actinomycetota bacterium]
MLLRRVARPLLAAIFVSGGIQELLDPDQKAKAATPLIEKGLEVLPVDRFADPATMVQADAAMRIGAGLLLAFGKAPRFAATALAASLIPTTAIAHPFWEANSIQRGGQQTQFLKNAGLLGGLLLAAADTGGKPSVGWRARRAKKDAARAAKAAKLARKGRKALKR